MEQVLERVQWLKEAVTEGNNGKDTSAEKFDALWDLTELLSKCPKEKVAQIEDFSKLINTALNQSPIGEVLFRVLSAASITLLNCEPSNSKSSVTTLKSLLTTLSSAKANAPLSVRVATVRTAGRINKEKPIHVASLLSETVTVLSKIIKGSEVPMKIAALEALRETLEGAAYSGSFVHEEAIKSIRGVLFDKSMEVRIAALKCLSSLSHATTSFTFLEGNKGGLALCVKIIEESISNSLVRKTAAEAIGAQLSSALLQYLATPQHNSSAASSQAKKTPATVWNLEAIFSFFSSMFKGKKETKAGIAQCYVSFLRKLKTKYLENHLEAILSNILSLLNSITPKTNIDDAAQSRLCISYILRYGIGTILGEAGQQTAAKILATILQKTTDNESISVCVIIELCHLLLVLGEGALHVRETLTQDILPSLLVQTNSSLIRYYAAICFRSIAIAMPNHLAHILSDAIAKAVLEHASLPTGKPEKLKQHLLSLQGYSQAVAALIAAIPMSKLGVPSPVLSFALQTATAILKTESTNSTVLLATAESGWAIVGSLMKLGPSFIEPRLAALFTLWNASLNCDSGVPKAEKDILLFAQIKSESLTSLCAFIANNPTLLTPKVRKQIVSLLGAILGVLGSLPEVKEQNTALVITQFKTNLFRVFNALPTDTYANCNVPLLRVLVGEVTEGPAVSLKNVLNQKDSILGPWFQVEQEQELQEEQLVAPTAKHIQDLSIIWSSSVEEALAPATDIYTLLVLASVELFSKIYVSQVDKNKQHLLDHFIACLKAAPNQAKKAAIYTNLLFVILSILKETIKRRATTGAAKATLADLLKSYILESTTEIRRAAGEALGLLASAEGDAFSNELIKFFVAQIKKIKDPVPRSGFAFALGSIKRSMGGMHSPAHLQTIVSAYQEILKEYSPIAQTWTLHALCLTVEAAGALFNSQVNSTISLLYSLLLSEEFTSTDDYQLVGRIVHAVVHALGPELQATSKVMSRCSAICGELRTHPHPLVQLESIRFIQSLILFAPQAVDVAATIPFLRAQFNSPYVVLRRNAVICIRQLVQIDAAKVNVDNLEQEIFMMLDSELDPKSRNELQLLVTTLLDIFAPPAPSHWIQLCKQMVLTSASSMRGSAAPRIKRHDEETSNPNEDDNVSGILKSVQVTDAADNQDDVFVPRWGTKVFSMECVRRIISLVSGVPQHFDLIVARREQEFDNTKDFLVFNLSDMVKMSFVIATSEFEDLRPIGVFTIKDIVEHFAHALDPDYEGHSLLEMYQAQIGSALRPAFETDAPPFATAAAASVLVSYLTSGNVNLGLTVSHSDIIPDSDKGINKVISLLTSRVDGLPDMTYPGYSEKATTMVQISILSALAQLHISSLTSKGSRLCVHLKPYLGTLKKHWLNLLRDYAVLSTQSKATKMNYKATFFTFFTIQEVTEYFTQSWAVILLACTSLVSTQYWKENEAETEEDTKKNFNLLLGISMHALSAPLDSKHTSTCLRALTNLLAPSYLTAEYVSHDLFKELLDLINTVLETGDHNLALDAMKLIHHIASNTNTDYFHLSGETLLHSLLEAAVFSLHHNIINLFSTSENAPVKVLDDVAVISTLQTTISTFCAVTSLFNDESAVRYVPALLWILVRICVLASTSATLRKLSDDAVQAIRKLSATQCTSEQWEHILHSALVTVLAAAKSNVEESSVLVAALFAVLTELPNKTDCAGIHYQCLQLFQQCLSTANVKLQTTVLQGLKNLLNDTAAETIRKKVSLQYLQGLGPHIVLLLHRLSKLTGQISQEDVVLCSESIRLLVSAQTLSPAEHQPTMLSVVIPSLIGLLRPTTPNAIHELALQVLLKLAGTVAEFKNQVNQLSVFERQQLETAVRLSVLQAQQATQRVETTVTTAKPLKLDFSKYS